MKKELELWDLSETKTYVKLKKDVISEFFNYAIRLAGSESKLAHKIGIKKIGNIWYYKTISGFVPLHLIEKIINILPDDKRIELKKKIEDNVKELRYGYGRAKSIKNPKLPIRFSPALFRILGHLIGDGGIRATKGDYPVYYTNKCYTLVKQFKEDVLKILGDVDTYEYHNKNDSTVMVRYPSIVGIIFIKFFGYQVSDLKHIPEIISIADKESKVMFLRALMDDEGCVSSNRVCFGISNRSVIENVREMLNEFGIETGVIIKRDFKEKWKTHYQFGIFGRNDLQLFENIIGFDDPKKSGKLRELIEGYRNKRSHYKRGKIKSLIVRELENKDMNIYELSIKLNRKPSYRLREQLYKLERDKLIKSRIEKGRFKIYKKV
jgi:intein/homing endonuclease